MSLCTACGKINAADDPFCGVCGRLLQAQQLNDSSMLEEDAIYCGICGAKNVFDDQFCGKCGAVLPKDPLIAQLPPQSAPGALAAAIKPLPMAMSQRTNVPIVKAGAIIAALLLLLGAGAWFTQRRTLDPAQPAATFTAPTRVVIAPASANKAAVSTSVSAYSLAPTAPDQALAASAVPATRAAVSSAEMLLTQAPTLSAPTTVSFGALAEQKSLRITASGSAPSSTDDQRNTTNYAPGNAVDGIPETAWRVPGDGIGQSLMLEFATPIQVSEIQIIPGYAKIDKQSHTDRFLQNRRVTQIRLEFSDGSSQIANLAERAQLQAVPLSTVLTSSIRIVVLQTTTPATVDGRDFTPISEVVVLGRAQLP